MTAWGARRVRGGRPAAVGVSRSGSGRVGVEFLLAGASTAGERPCKAIENPVIIQDLHATIYHTLGISPRLAYVVEKRPFYVTYNGEGKPILDLLRRTS